MKKIISLIVVATMLMSLFVVAPVSAATSGTVTTAATKEVSFGGATAIDVSGVSGTSYTCDFTISGLDWLGDGAYIDGGDGIVVDAEGIAISSFGISNATALDLSIVPGTVQDTGSGTSLKIVFATSNEGANIDRLNAVNGALFTINYTKHSANTGSTGTFSVRTGSNLVDSISGYETDVATVCEPCTITFEKAAAKKYDVPVYTAEELGGVGSTPITTLTDKETVTAADVASIAPAVTGHTFSKWVYGTSYEAATDASFPLTLVDGGSLYAVYTANSYPVTWTAPEGGTMAVTAGGSTITSGTSVKYGTQVAVTLTPNTAEYWSGGALTKNGVASDLTFTMPAEAVALAATFTAPGAASVVIKDKATDKVLATDSSLTAGDSFTLSADLVSVPANKVFDGFEVDGQMVGTQYTIPAVAGEVVVYAVFSWEEYSITFVADGATGVPATIEGLTAEDTFAGAYADNNIADYTPVKDGQTFTGWTATEGGTTAFVWGNTKVTSDVTLYPMWYTLETGSGIKNVTIAGLAAAVDGTTYSASVANSVSSANVIINLAADAQKATITIDGEAVNAGTAKALDLADGENTFAVVVTAEDGSTSEYTIVITRAAATASLQIEVGNTIVSPAYKDEVATIPVKVGGASVDTDFWATVVEFTYDNTIFTFAPATDILWNGEVSYQYSECNAIDNNDGTTSVYFAVVLEGDPVNIAASDWLTLADLQFTLKADQESNSYTDIFVKDYSNYTPDPAVDAVAYGNLAENPYGRVTFLINNPAITEAVINSKEDGTGVAGGIEVTRETVYVTEVKAVKDPNAAVADYYDFDTDNVELAYQWTRDGVDIAGATDSSYLLTDDDEGCAIAVKITITDLDSGKDGTSTIEVFDTVYHRGDANTSFKLDVSDSATINGLINGTTSITDADKLHIYNAHVDDPYMDNTRDAADVTSLLQLMVKLIDHAAFDVLGE